MEEKKKVICRKTKNNVKVKTKSTQMHHQEPGFRLSALQKLLVTNMKENKF